MDGPETGSPGIHCFSERRLALDKDMKQVLLKIQDFEVYDNAKTNSGGNDRL
jgi:hypothetical protein